MINVIYVGWLGSFHGIFRAFLHKSCSKASARLRVRGGRDRRDCGQCTIPEKGAGACVPALCQLARTSQLALQSTLHCSPHCTAVHTALQSTLHCRPHCTAVHTTLQSKLQCSAVQCTADYMPCHTVPSELLAAPRLQDLVPRALCPTMIVPKCSPQSCTVPSVVLSRASRHIPALHSSIGRLRLPH